MRATHNLLASSAAAGELPNLDAILGSTLECFELPAGPSFDDYRITNQLGTGTDGSAFTGYRKLGSPAMELRLLTAAGFTTERRRDFERRVRLLELVPHPAVVRPLELRLDSSPPYAAFEPLPRQTLLGASSRMPRNRPESFLMLVRNCTAAVAAAHRVGLSHGNLNPWSIRLDPEGWVRLDFSGLAVGGDGSEQDEVERCLWAAPESTRSEPTADVFSLATVVVWLLTGETPPFAPGWEALGAKLLPLLAPKYGERRAAEIRECLAACLAPAAAERPLSSELLRLLCDMPLRGNARPGDIPTAVPVEHAQGLRPAATALPHAEPEAAADGSATQTLARPPGAPRPKTRLGHLPGDRIGRFEVLEKLGEGAMGSVYKCRDLADDRQVAVKVLRPDLAAEPQSLKRFHKEARLLAEANNPHVANLLEINEDSGVHYLVLEFVGGIDLKRWLAQRPGPLPETTALEILADAARGLVIAHERKIVHRDIKPANILVEIEPAARAASPKDSTVDDRAGLPRIRLSDFGLARHIDQTESLDMTQTGALLGTPFYMAPEQCTAKGEVTPSTDVYALGVTLFELLAGRPPFQADDAVHVASMHCFEPPPALQKLNPEISDGAVRIVEKALAKRPEQRHADAAEFLRDIERLLKGEPTAVQAHPLLPPHDPSKLFAADFEWDLVSSPHDLWPYVSNTERLNRAAGLPPVVYAARRDADGRLRQFGTFSLAGLKIAWEEHPFEWVEGLRHGVFREFSQGPFLWFLSTVELIPRAGGETRLKHSVRIAPRGFAGRLIAKMEAGLKGKRALDKIYPRIDAALAGKLGTSPLVDHFEAAPRLTAPQRRRLDERLAELAQRAVSPQVVERLGEFLAAAPAQELARIRPLALARRLGLEAEAVVSGCLHAAKTGLLVLQWDIICPTCRISAGIRETLREIEAHSRCEVCNLDFELDFANSLELVLRSHPEVRVADPQTYCSGGPEHAPHVVAQVRVAAGERLDLPTCLSAGEYVLRGPQLPYAIPLSVDAVQGGSRVELEVAPRAERRHTAVVRAGHQVVSVTNSCERELLLRLERTVPRQDVLTAAQASTLALFRELFADEALSPGRLVNLATVTLLVAEVHDLDRLYAEYGDGRLFGILQALRTAAAQHTSRSAGAVVKFADGKLLAVFESSVAAVEAALQLPAALGKSEATRQMELRLAVHRGPALVTTADGRIDYFGLTVQMGARLAQAARPGELLVSETVMADSEVAALLMSTGSPEFGRFNLAEGTSLLAQRVTLAAAGGATALGALTESRFSTGLGLQK